MKIEKLILEGMKILECDEFQESYRQYKSWRQSILEVFEHIGVSQRQIGQIKLTMHYVETPFSQEQNYKKLKESVSETLNCLKHISENETENLSHKAMLLIVRRVLVNFYLHIKTMYQEKPHGRGTIKQEDLSRIVIGNEYDVQHILYSLLKPIFPEARVEVNTDSGNSGFRYDICLDEQNLVIEVKCSRTSMTEKSLTEELGADAFHYKTETLFFFIYDKENIIKNVEAFKASHFRTKESFNKDVEVFIVQPVKL